MVIWNKRVYLFLFFLPVCVYYFVFGWTEANHLSTVFVFGFNSADKATFFDLFEPKDGKVSINKQPVKTKYTFGVVISIDVNKKTFGVLSRGGYRSYAFYFSPTFYGGVYLFSVTPVLHALGGQSSPARRVLHLQR